MKTGIKFGFMSLKMINGFGLTHIPENRIGVEGKTIQTKLKAVDSLFKIYKPKEYRKTRKLIKCREKTITNKDLLDLSIQNLESIAAYNNLDCIIDGRVKSTYSVWQKLLKCDNRIQDVRDLVAVRIIINNEYDCHEILDIIKSYYPTRHNTYKDYVSHPKLNGYQSLHETLYISNSQVELQIRTRDMHDNCEFGSAAHYKYKLRLCDSRILNLYSAKKDTSIINERRILL
tara:strand:+ start:598 stop:1290 length:693 start_codon:yes stop_codon:yes gene_type:complete